MKLIKYNLFDKFISFIDSIYFNLYNIFIIYIKKYEELEMKKFIKMLITHQNAYNQEFFSS